MKASFSTPREIVSWTLSALSALGYLPGILAKSVLAKPAWDLYAKVLIKHPLVTKSLTSCCTNAISDLICQKTMPAREEKTKKFDSKRLLHVMVTGIVWSGPVTHYWYKLLFGQMTGRINDPLIRLVVNIVLDAIIFSPVTISGYFTVRSFLEGTGFAGAREKLRTRLLKAVLGAWKFWPAANVINFGFVPIVYRVLYNNILSIFWQGYLTYVNSQKIAKQKKELSKES